jgi:hypothetical protein
VRYTDRSRIEKDWRCPRARFWTTEFGGRGISPAGKSFDLEFGTIVHEGVELAVAGQPHAAMAASERVAAFVSASGGDQIQATQWGAIGYGLVAGFMRSVWPQLQQEYELVATEREVLLQLTPDLTLQARPDLVLRHRLSGALWNCELKTTGYIEAQWLQAWTKAPQLQLTVLAAEESFGEAFAGSIVVGLYKGRKGRDGRQSSPFAWGWRTEDLPGILRPQFSYEEQRRKGWERFLTQGYPGGVAQWVADMPEELLARQFAVTEPIFLRRDLVDALVRQVVHREDEIARAAARFAVDGTVTPAVLDEVFPQYFNNCTPAFGHNCEFNEPCWVPWVGRDPLASGLFVPREPHHEAERKVFELKEVA